MGLLHSLAEFALDGGLPEGVPPSYWYTGLCPQTGQRLRLPRTLAAETIAQRLMQQLAQQPEFQCEGKMYGILLARTTTGEAVVLQAFSGYLNGMGTVPGWVPPIPGRDRVALAEAQTLERLEQINAKLLALQQLPARATYATLTQTYASRLQALTELHQRRKADRDRQRMTYRTTLSGDTLVEALESLITASQQDGIERRRLKRERDQRLAPLTQAIAQADQQIQILRRQRKTLSQQLQAQMHAVYSLTNFAGVSTTLQDLMPDGLPTGTGDCAAPKLLHYAATHQLTPLAMAEFWWGPPSGDKVPGQFYEACSDRCQPIMGFLLSGLPTPPPPVDLAMPLPLLYQDDVLVVVDKPSGLLSVPGRRSELQDSVLSRLRCQLTPYDFLQAVHRLDKGTSGVLVLAATPEAHANLSQQFAQRQVYKTYEAILSRSIASPAGTIELPLWGDPCDRPKQSVNYEQGKPSLTQYQVLTVGTRPRVKFVPKTGRTHQLRVHAAHPDGLNAPIWGDTLYGQAVEATATSERADRLHLHATALHCHHPVSRKALRFTSPVPF